MSRKTQGERPDSIEPFIQNKGKIDESDFRFGLIVDNIPAMIAFVDEDLQYRFVNKEYEKVLKINRSQVIGKRIRDMVSAEQFNYIKPKLDAVLSGETVSYESFFEHPVGNYYLQVNYIPYRIAGIQGGFLAIIFDITEYKQAEKALQRSEAQTRHLLDSIAEGIVGVDRSGICTFVNPACLGILEISATEPVIGRPFYDLVHPNGKGEADGYMAECVISKSWLEGEVVNRNDDYFTSASGKQIAVSYVANPILENGEVQGAVIVFSDNTKQKEQENKLLNELQQFQSITENRPGVSYQFVRKTNGQTELLYITKNVEQLFGLSHDEVMKSWRLLFDLVHPDDLPEVEKSVWHAIDKGLSWEADYRVIWRDKSVGWMRASSVARLEDSGEVVWNGMFADITNEVKEKTELLAYRGRLEDLVTERTRQLTDQARIIQEIRGAVIMVDKHYTIKVWNRGAELLFKYQKSEVLNRHISVLACKEVTKNICVDAGKDEKYGLANHLEIVYVDRFEKEIPIEFHFTYVENKDKDSDFFIIYASNVTERKRVEKLKDEFVSTVSHELRTPLTAIKGSLGLINGHGLAGLDRQSRDLMAIATRNTDKLLLLVNDILDFEKLQSGGMRYEKRKIKAEILLRHLLQVNQVPMGSNMSEIKLESSAILGYIYADADRIEQVVSNLVSNATKFSYPHSTVLLSAFLVGDIVRISVMDYGPGIPESFKPRLFEKFSQAQQSINNKHRGSGLGLSICKFIIEAHGGSVNYETAEGIGSVFYFDLFISSEKGFDYSHHVSSQRSQEKVMDVTFSCSQKARRFFSLHLTRLGYKVGAAKSGPMQIEVRSAEELGAGLVVPGKSLKLLIGINSTFSKGPELEGQMFLAMSVPSNAAQRANLSLVLAELFSKGFGWELHLNSPEHRTLVGGVISQITGVRLVQDSSYGCATVFVSELGSFMDLAGWKPEKGPYLLLLLAEGGISDSEYAQIVKQLKKFSSFSDFRILPNLLIAASQATEVESLKPEKQAGRSEREQIESLH
ncbi:MAG: PAS domain S-box protein [Gammaproteobacteria bacterium]|nr:PAS domain S-box protein [Gammaproteobacteria bacterium]